MVPLNIINTVLRKFQTAPRQVGFLNKEPYKSLPREEKAKYLDRNQEVYLSSAWYKAHESWDRVTDYIQKHAEGKKYFVCQLPYQLAIKEGLLDPEQVADEMSESSFNEVMWEMEMNAMFWGEHENSYFSYEEIEKNRTLKRVFYPSDVTDMVNDSKVKPPTKKDGEVRLVSADIATMSNSSSDASIFTVARLIPVKNGYERQVMYMEDVVGGHTESQATRIRQLYEDFDADYIVLDTMGVGIGVYDQLTTELTNSVTGETYEPLSCMNDDSLAERCSFPNAPKVIYSIRASAELNAKIAATFKDALRKKRIKFPVHEGETKDILSSIKGYDKLDAETRSNLVAPYVQTTLMANEILNLEQEITSTGILRLKEPRSSRKDRYTSVSYLNYFANEYEVENRETKKKDNTNALGFFMAKPSKLF